jgi:hypothetical protein
VVAINFLIAMRTHHVPPLHVKGNIGRKVESDFWLG